MCFKTPATDFEAILALYKKRTQQDYVHWSARNDCKHCCQSVHSIMHPSCSIILVASNSAVDTVHGSPDNCLALGRVAM